MTLSWSIIDPFKLKIEQFLLYYTDMTDVVRQFPIPMDLIKREKQFTFSLNLSSFDPKFNQYHLLRLYLTAMDRQKNQHFVNSSIIHCLLPRRYGKRRKKTDRWTLLLIDRWSKIIHVRVFKLNIFRKTHLNSSVSSSALIDLYCN